MNILVRVGVFSCQIRPIPNLRERGQNEGRTKGERGQSMDKTRAEGKNASGVLEVVCDLAIISNLAVPFPDTSVNHPGQPLVICIRGATGQAGETAWG